MGSGINQGIPQGQEFDDSNMDDDNNEQDNNEEPPTNGVDNKAQKASGDLSYILPDSNEETVNYVMGMISSAIGKNDNVGQSDVDKWADKMIGKDSKEDDDEENKSDEDDKTSDDSLQNESSIRTFVNKVIDEVFNMTKNDEDKSVEDRSEKKLDNEYKKYDNNPFVSPF